MKRQITIYESARNGKITVFNDVECNTLGELKTLLREKGIDYSDKEFVEGVTNTKLLSDDSRIPTNIPFKGQTTNDVFINILNKDTKIKSGVNYAELSRADLLRAAKPYAKIIEYELGMNYTRAKSADIIAFLEKEDAKLKPGNCVAKEEKKEEKKEDKCNCNVEKKLNMLKKALVWLADQMEYDEEVDEMLEGWDDGEVNVEEAKTSNFSFEDIQSFIRK